MAEADMMGLVDFKEKNCRFLPERLKTKGLHKLFYVCRLGFKSYSNILERVVWYLFNFPGLGGKVVPPSRTFLALGSSSLHVESPLIKYLTGLAASIFRLGIIQK